MKPVVMRPRGSRAGFSLAELMVVIVIIGLLATQVVPKLMQSFGQAQLTKAKADINAIADAIVQFRINNAGRFPESLEQLVTKDANGKSYLDRQTVPKDPWDHEYIYFPPRSGESDPEVISYGADGAQGGEDDNRDITLSAIKNQEI